MVAWLRSVAQRRSSRASSRSPPTALGPSSDSELAPLWTRQCSRAFAANPTAVWNVYLAQTTNDGGSFTQSVVSKKSNHTGAICTGGVSCAPGTRNLLDLFEVAVGPQNGKAAVIYTDDRLTTFTGAPLPQIVLAQQN